MSVIFLNAVQWHSQEFDLGVYVLTSHYNFKTCVNVPHVNKTVTDFFWGEGYIYRYTPRRYAPDTSPQSATLGLHPVAVATTRFPSR